MGLRLQRRALGLALLVAASASCGDSSHASGGGPSGAVCPTASTLTYESFGEAFMTRYCTRCHGSGLVGPARNGAPSDHDFDSLADIATMAMHIDERAAAGPARVNTVMPPSGEQPSEAERRQLGEWLACGAP